MDLATIKEEHHLAPSELISQVFAPRYITRSKAAVDAKAEDVECSVSEDSRLSTLVEHQSAGDTSHSTPSEWETSSETQSSTMDKDSLTISPEVTVITPREVVSSLSGASSRKRGRHKEYTAPTGVWKTNGGYISTVYVGNRRIYGPLRDNAEEAGVDRQKLIEAKAFAKTESEMRSYIATLKSANDQTGGVCCSDSLHLVTKQQEERTTKSENDHHRPMNKKRRIMSRLSTVTSAATTIEVPPSHLAS